MYLGRYGVGGLRLIIRVPSRNLFELQRQVESGDQVLGADSRHLTDSANRMWTSAGSAQPGLARFRAVCMQLSECFTTFQGTGRHFQASTYLV